MLPFVVSPIPGENLHGFVRRLFDANFLANLRQGRAAAGITGLTPSSADDGLWKRLSEASGQSVDVLSPMRWLPVASDMLQGMVTFCGQPIQKKFLRTGKLRICPECVKESGIIQDAWFLFYAVACPWHGCLLVEQCDCFPDQDGRPRALQLISSARPWECRCGRRFGDISAQPASQCLVDAMVALFRLVVGRPPPHASHRGLNEAFLTLSTNDLLTAIDIIGVAATTAIDQDEHVHSDSVRYRHGLIDQSLSLEQCRTRVDAASAIMSNWPHAYYDLLDTISYRNKAACHQVPEREAFATAIGQTVLFPRRGLDGAPLPILQETIDAYCRDRLKIRRRKRNLATSLPIARMLPPNASISALMKAADGRVPRERMRKAYEIKLRELAKYSSWDDPECLADKFREEINACLLACADSVSSVSAARILEGRTYDQRLLGWNHPDLLVPDGSLEGFFGKRSESYRLSDVLALKTTILGQAQPVQETVGLMPLRDALRHLLLLRYKK